MSRSILFLFSFFCFSAWAQVPVDELGEARRLNQEIHFQLQNFNGSPQALSEARRHLDAALAALQGGSSSVDCRDFANQVYRDSGWTVGQAMAKAKSLCQPLEMTGSSINVLRLGHSAYLKGGWTTSQALEKSAAQTQGIPEIKYPCVSNAYKNYLNGAWTSGVAFEKAVDYCR